MKSQSFLLLLCLATLSGTAMLAQSYGPAGQSSAPYAQTAPAPIQRGYAQGPAARPGVRQVEVVEGIVVRSAPGASVETIQADPDRTEIRVDRGLANVSVYHPEHHGQILVDLPGGQTAILEDGLYTFNAATNTVRVYKGEAEAFASNNDSSVKIHDSHYVTFSGGELHAIPGNNTTARADVLPGVYADAYGGDRNRGDGYRNGYRGYGSQGYGYGNYGYGYGGYGYPGYGYGGYGAGYHGGGSPYGFGFGGYPYGYGYGYPYGGLSIGLGFGFGGYGRGYYGGGGYRGGGFGYRGFRR